MYKSLKINLAFYLGLILMTNELKVTYGSGWDYKHPDEWKEMFPNDCAGSRQSPIDISFGSDVITRGPLRLEWNNYRNKPKNMTITNNGHSVQLDVQWGNSKDVPFVTSELFHNNEYVFSQLHFHWGAHNTEGSEHTFNGHGLPLELHMVHFKREYGSLGNASSYPDGIVVVGSFYNVSNVKSVAVQDILDAAEKVEEEGSSWQIENFLLSDFEVVNDKTSWISYNGSLTTPQCLEVVTWLLSLDPYDVTENQIRKIRSLKLSHNDDHDNRPTQPLNGRKITLYTVLFF